MERGETALQALVSVRDVDEARLVARAGVRLVDLKEPRAGALGALPVKRIDEIVQALRAEGARCETSATVGDWPDDALDAVLAQVQRVAACGVHKVKVGIGRRAPLALLDALAASGAPIVPVLIADAGIEPAIVDACCARFDTLMVDTADKQSGSLFDVAAPDAVRGVIAAARQAGRRVGLAGALRLADVPRLHAHGVDFAGFRSAVCDGDRGGALSQALLHELLRALADDRLRAAA
jgi:uncharacterized protein (UPF0264 family)